MTGHSDYRAHMLTTLVFFKIVIRRRGFKFNIGIIILKLVSVIVLRLLSGLPVSVFSGHRNSSFYVKSSVSPDDQYLASGSSDGHAYIWKVRGLSFI